MSNDTAINALNIAIEKAKDALRRNALAQAYDTKSTKWISPKGTTLYVVRRA